MNSLFSALEEANRRPAPFECYTAVDLWTDEHTSEKMLGYHLNADLDVSSRRTVFINRSVEWMTSTCKVGTDTRIADFGCGPGLYTNRLAKLGAQVTGIDVSKRSLDYARRIAAEQALTVDYVHGNYLEIELEDSFDLILMIMCDFCALSPPQRMAMLKTFHSLLAPGGCVLLDVYSLDAFANWKEEATYDVNQLDGFWSPDTYYGFLNRFKYEGEKVLLDKYTIFDPERTRIVYNWLQHFSPESLWAEFSQAGFADHQLYCDVAGTPFAPGTDEFALLATK